MNDITNDRIDIVLPALPCRIGVLPGENDRTQPVRVEMSVEVDLRRAAASGDIEHTLDYGELHGRLRDRVLGGTWTLLEALAGALLDEALDFPRVRVARVMVEKCTPPFPTAIGPVRVHMRREGEVTA